MTPTELRNLGDQHGRGWQTRLARAVPVDVRTVRRYLSGRISIRPVIAMRIRQVFAEWRKKKSNS